MLAPHPIHLFDGDVLRLRHEEECEDGHYKHEGGEEEEEPELEVAKHGKESLRDDKGEEEVDRNGDCLTS